MEYEAMEAEILAEQQVASTQQYYALGNHVRPHIAFQTRQDFDEDMEEMLRAEEELLRETRPPSPDDAEVCSERDVL